VTNAGPFELRPMGIGDILDAAIRLYRARFVAFLTISLIVYIPYVLVLLLAGQALVGPPEYVETPFGQQAVYPPGVLLFQALSRMLFFIVVWPLVQGALTYNISAEYLGERISAAESYRRAARRMLPLIGTQFAAGLVVMLGFLLLIVPGVIFSLWYMIVPPVVLLETLSGGRAMSRSHELMKGNLGKGFTLAFLVALLNLLVTAGFGAVLGVMGLAENQVVIETVTNLVEAFLLPFLVAPTILLYYDLRIRKEGLDLQVLAASLPQVKAPV
jgi:hypothetical protein